MVFEAYISYGYVTELLLVKLRYLDLSTVLCHQICISINSNMHVPARGGITCTCRGSAHTHARRAGYIRAVGDHMYLLAR